MNYITPNIPEEKSKSWSLSASLTSRYSKCQLCLPLYLEGGIGKAKSLWGVGIGIVSIKAFLIDDEKKYGFKPEAVWVYSKNRHGFQLSVARELATGDNTTNTEADVQYRYTPVRDIDIQVGYNKFHSEAFSTSVSFYF